MSTLTLLDAIERPSILGVDGDRFESPSPRADRADGEAAGQPAVGGTPTLDELLTDTWESLMIGRTATCPICDGALEPRYAAGHTPVAGRCTSCGTELS
ncbi:MAG TPA: hypothetical protein VNZ62_06760 [Capillimicrobium sp.]|nr:hypothetical protein [Capillimicrobium sp.]